MFRGEKKKEERKKNTTRKKETGYTQHHLAARNLVFSHPYKSAVREKAAKRCKVDFLHYNSEHYTATVPLLLI